MRASVLRITAVGALETGIDLALRDSSIALDAVAGGSMFSIFCKARRLRPQLLHARVSFLSTALVGRALGVPVTLEIGPEQVSPSSARATRFATRTLCGGPVTRDALIAAGGSPARISVVRGLIDALPQRSEPYPPQAPQWIACAAPIDDPERGVSELLLAFFSVARERPLARLLLTGAGDAASTTALAESAGFRGRVACARKSPDRLPSMLADATVLVGPARSASHADAIPEAMAAGVATIATAVGPHPAWIRDGRTGFLVPPRAPVPLAARLAQLLDDPALATRLGDAGRQIATDLCAPRNRAAELARCWTSVIRPLATVRVPLLQSARTA